MVSNFSDLVCNFVGSIVLRAEYVQLVLLKTMLFVELLYFESYFAYFFVREFLPFFLCSL